VKNTFAEDTAKTVREHLPKKRAGLV